MMRITITRRAERHSTTPLQNGKTGRWHLVPTTYCAGIWTYHWGRAYPHDYKTKKEALEVRKELRSKGLI